MKFEPKLNSNLKSNLIEFQPQVEPKAKFDKK